MSNSSVSEWSTTPDNNSDIAGVNIAEGCPPSGVNNAIRIMMAQIATFLSSVVASAASVAEVLAGVLNTKSVTPLNLYGAAAPVTVGYTSTITLDLSTGSAFEIGVLTGNLTLANPTNARAGSGDIIRLRQDSTGGRTVTMGSAWKALNLAQSFQTAGSAVDLVSYKVWTTSPLLIYYTVTRAT